MKYILPVFLALLFIALPRFIWVPVDKASSALSEKAQLFLYPQRPRQGEPVLIRIKAPDDLTVTALNVGTSTVPVFPYQGEKIALFPIDLRAATGTRKVVVWFSDSRGLASDFEVEERVRISASLGIPQKLGGNTTASQMRLVGDLAGENAVLDSLESVQEILWKEPFMLPLASSTITDPYGYSRLTGSYSLAHKGTDFRAKKGTEVFSMNEGKVVLAREFRVYGKTVVIDHGFGLQSLYMHLSQIDVVLGQKVNRGERIGLSGDTGYAESPHLHVSLRIRGISIDPLAFIALFSDVSGF